ncbi:hypothetical protein [Streptomyces sp. NPDC056480]|uniref:hypothetical protein n=1 Tax=Streptomyces sp. NPDC056480 TaxID=3345833 RepID=UPI0036BEC155
MTLELLRTPLHLSVFSRLSASARAASYRTLQELYARYTDELREEIETQAAALDWSGITGALCASMSERETLQAPMALLDGFARQHIKVFESHGVLVRDAEQVGFFHETYFDYLFARSFVSAQEDIHDFLAGSGQYLFRRAQTRQILEHLAGTDRDRFRVTVAQLLSSDQIRPHLHDQPTNSSMPFSTAGLPDHLEHLVSALYEHTVSLPSVAIDSCERIVQHAGKEMGDLRTHRAADGHHLISAVLRLYRQSPQPERIRCLDIIDLLAQAGAYPLTDALENER